MGTASSSSTMSTEISSPTSESRSGSSSSIASTSPRASVLELRAAPRRAPPPPPPPPPPPAPARSLRLRGAPRSRPRPRGAVFHSPRTHACSAGVISCGWSDLQSGAVGGPRPRPRPPARSPARISWSSACGSSRRGPTDKKRSGSAASSSCSSCASYASLPSGSCSGACSLIELTAADRHDLKRADTATASGSAMKPTGGGVGDCGLLLPKAGGCWLA